MTALLPIDFETVGLCSKTLTALEVAWSIIDLDGTQRLPMRSRYCLFSGRSSLPSLYYPKSSNVNGWFWSQDGGTDDVRRAKLMAQESGLFDDWLAAPKSSLITSGDQLERMLLDDIAEVCKPDEYVHITGAGAARFDFGILAEHCRAVLPKLSEKYPTHYRPVDTSIIQTGLLGSAHEVPLLAWGRKAFGEGSYRIWLDTPPRYMHSSDAVAAWLFDDAQEHRSAPDVARSIAVQATMWRYAAPLRTEVGIPELHRRMFRHWHDRQPGAGTVSANRGAFRRVD